MHKGWLKNEMKYTKYKFNFHGKRAISDPPELKMPGLTRSFSASSLTISIHFHWSKTNESSRKIGNIRKPNRRFSYLASSKVATMAEYNKTNRWMACGTWPIIGRAFANPGGFHQRRNHIWALVAATMCLFPFKLYKCYIFIFPFAVNELKAHFVSVK